MERLILKNRDISLHGDSALKIALMFMDFSSEADVVLFIGKTKSKITSAVPIINLHRHKTTETIMCKTLIAL